MKRYEIGSLDDLPDFYEADDGTFVLFEDVQQLARDVDVRIAHKEECSLISDYHEACDCGFVELRARLQSIIDGDA